MNQQTLKKQHTMAFGFSGARLALNYYMFEDGIPETDHLPEVFIKSADCFRNQLRIYLDGGDSLEELKNLRSAMMKEMEIITGYADCFQIYEYVLNRLERRYHTGLRPVAEEGITDELMEFIVGDKDSMAMNGRIQQVIAQLPIRFTKQKFFGMVREALSVYHGADRSSLNNLMYRLKSGAMADLPEAMNQGYEDLYEVLEQFRKLDYKNMDQDLYDECTKKVVYISDRLNLLADWYISLEQLINDLYVLLITRADAVADVKETQIIHQILAGLLCHAGQSSVTVLPDELVQLLTDLEGVQEHYYEKYQRSEAVDQTVDLLLSGSDFVPLEPAAADKEDEVPVDQAGLDAAAESFFEELTQLFAGQPKPVVRAVMAKVLSELPVCFNQLNEIRTYIENSFASCSDSNERESCIDLLRQMMESENALV